MRSAVLLTLFAVAACAPSSTTETAPPSPTPAPVAVATQTGRPVIATLETQNRRVSILSGTSDGDLRVSVRDREGAMIADGITIDELTRTDPLLGALITNAVASKSDGTYVDARLDLPHR